MCASACRSRRASRAAAKRACSSCSMRRGADMDTHALRGQAAVVGTGLSEFGEVPGWSHFELMAQAVERALADAGLKKSDVDGVFCVVDRASLPAAMAAEYFGIRPK